MTTPILELSELQEASPLAHIIANTNFRLLEAFSGRLLVNITTATPPGSPAESDCYYVAASPTGAWVGHAGEVACYIQGAWYFWPVLTGHSYWNLGTSALIRWNGSAWV